MRANNYPDQEYKRVFIGLLTGLLINALLNVPLLYGFYKIGLPAYYGSTTATILGYLVCAFICLIFLHKKYQVDYEETVKCFIEVTTSVTIMAIVLLLLKILLPYSTPSRLINIIIIIIYTIIGGIIYLGITIKNKTLYKVFGNDIILKILNKFKKRGRI